MKQLTSVWSMMCILICCFTGCSVGSKELTGEEIYNKIYESTVEISAESDYISSLGTGFYIDANGTVVTNYHVIESCHTIDIKTQEGITYKVESILGFDKDRDLATIFTRNIRLIFGTLLGISSWKNFREMYFDTIIVDEAGRATLSDLLVPCKKAKKLILVGDHKQLAPVIDENTEDTFVFDFSQIVFEALVCLAASELCREEDANIYTRLLYKYNDLYEGLCSKTLSGSSRNTFYRQPSRRGW